MYTWYNAVKKEKTEIGSKLVKSDSNSVGQTNGEEKSKRCMHVERYFFFFDNISWSGIWSLPCVNRAWLCGLKSNQVSSKCRLKNETRFFELTWHLIHINSAEMAWLLHRTYRESSERCIFEAHNIGKGFIFGGDLMCFALCTYLIDGRFFSTQSDRLWQWICFDITRTKENLLWRMLWQNR